MTKFLSVISLLVFTIAVTFVNPLKAADKATSSEIEFATKLKKTTLLVAIDNEKSIEDQELMDAVSTYWKFTPFKFVKSSEIEKSYSDPSFSFMLTVTYRRLDQENNVFSANFLSIMIGKKGATKLNDLIYSQNSKDVKSLEIVLPYDKKVVNKEVSVQMRDYSIYIPFYINYFQKIVEDFNAKKKIEYVAPDFGVKPIYYNDGKIDLQNKVLLINKNDLSNEFNKELFDKYFATNSAGLNLTYKIVDPSEIKKAIEKKDSKYVFWYNAQDFSNHKLAKGCSGIIYSCSDSKLLAYFNTLDKAKARGLQTAFVLAGLVASLALIVVFFAVVR